MESSEAPDILRLDEDESSYSRNRGYAAPRWHVDSFFGLLLSFFISTDTYEHTAAVWTAVPYSAASLHTTCVTVAIPEVSCLHKPCSKDSGFHAAPRPATVHIRWPVMDFIPFQPQHPFNA
jgi:hypothetical protein